VGHQSTILLVGFEQRRLGLGQEQHSTILRINDGIDTLTDQAIQVGLDYRTVLLHLSLLEHFTVIQHIPPNLVVERVTAHRKPPEVRIWRLSHQSRVGTFPPSTSTPHCPACWARR
jgi:hypothetical protein